MGNFGRRIKQVGPGAVVAAAFIGPGTVTTCTVSGASYGFTLLWALLFSTISVIILQSMASRLGLVKNMGLGEALRNKYTGKTTRILLAILIIAAVFIGNVAYETGNITGAIMGLQAIVPSSSTAMWAILIVICAVALLLSGKYRIVENILTAMVVLMGIVFLATAIAVGPNLGEIIRGLFVPHVPQGLDRAWFYVTGLIGTTVVPYNIYLHASSSAKKWGAESDKDEAIKTSLTDSILSIGLGGIISMAIVITAAAAFYGTGASITNGADMAVQLKPILGSWATAAFGIGLFAAGMTSTITAPLAAAFASTGVLGWGEDMSKGRFKAIWAIVIAFGFVATLTLGASPTEIILFAQAANAFLLPISAILLMVVTSDNKFMDGHGNSKLMLILGIIVVAVTLVIAFKNITGFMESLSSLIAAHQ